MMGSNAEYRAMDDFIKKNKIKPVVSGVWKGLNNAEGAFLEMKDGKQ
jgi:D-arabinose 1-dehydrogenase-like Zn-dependent alcohol dehydrogenase